MYKKTTHFLIFWFLYLWNVLMEQLHMWLCIKNNKDACFKMCFLAWDWMFLFVYVCVIVSRDSRNYYCTSMTSYVSGLSTEMTAKRNLNLPFGWVYSSESELQINILLWVLGYSQPVNTNPSSWKEKKQNTHTHTKLNKIIFMINILWIILYTYIYIWVLVLGSCQTFHSHCVTPQF